MCRGKVVQTLDRDAVILGLTRLREEWQEAANDIPLMDVQTSVGYLLTDVIGVLGLLPEEIQQVMGDEALDMRYAQTPLELVGL